MSDRWEFVIRTPDPFCVAERCDWCGGDAAVFDAGAAVAFGLMGMAFEIGAKRHLEACHRCGKANGSRIISLEAKELNPWNPEWVCSPCYSLERSKRLQTAGFPIRKGRWP